MKRLTPTQLSMILSAVDAADRNDGVPGPCCSPEVVATITSDRVQQRAIREACYEHAGCGGLQTRYADIRDDATTNVLASLDS